MSVNMMSKAEKAGFYTRGFTTFLIALVFTVVFVTGVVLYFSPKGRVAHWAGWTIWGLDKEGWSGVHMTATTVFTIAVGLHLFFNWKVLLNYIRNKRAVGFRLKKEFGAAFLVAFAIVAGTIVGFPPFSTVLAWNENIKMYWEETAGSPPVAHAEELTLDTFSERIGMSVGDVVKILRKAGVTVADDQVKIKSLADANGITPQDIHELLGKRGGNVLPDSGSGFGKMTLSEFAQSTGIAYAELARKLSSKGLAVGEGTKVKDIAGEMGLTPHELVERLQRAQH